LKSFSIPQLALEIAVIRLTEVGGKNSTLINDGNNDPEIDTTKNLSKHSVKKVIPEPLKNNISTTQRSEEVLEVNQVNHVDKPNIISITMSKVEDKWKELVARITLANNSIGALLKSSRLRTVEGNTIALDVSYKFHKERLESMANKKVIEKAIEEVLGQKGTIRCEVCQIGNGKINGESGNLTDLNIRLPHDVVIDSKTRVVEVFDGGLSV
jgi:hypothetical protein